MVAVMEQVGPSGLGHELMTEWAPWVEDDGDERHSWSVKPRVDHGYHGDMPERVKAVDKIIARHRLKYESDWKIIKHYYIRQREVWDIAKHFGWTESRVNLILMMMCGLVEREFRDLTGT